MKQKSNLLEKLTNYIGKEDKQERRIREQHFDREYSTLIDTYTNEKPQQLNSLEEELTQLYKSPGIFSRRIAPKISENVAFQLSKLRQEISTLKNYANIDETLIESLDDLIRQGTIEIVSYETEKEKLEKNKFSLLEGNGSLTAQELSKTVQQYIEHTKEQIKPLFEKKEYIDSRRKEGYFEFFGFGGEYKNKQTKGCLLRGDPKIESLIPNKISLPGQMKLSPTEYLKTELELYHSGKVLEEICFGKDMSGGFGGRSAVERAREADEKAYDEWELHILDEVINKYFAQQGEGPIVKLTEPQLSSLKIIVSHVEYNQDNFSLDNAYLRKTSRVIDAIEFESQEQKNQEKQNDKQKINR